MQARGFTRIAGALAVATLIGGQAKAQDIELGNNGDNNVIDLSHVGAGSISVFNTGPGNSIFGSGIHAGSLELGNTGDNGYIDLSKIKTPGDVGAQNNGNNGIIVAHGLTTGPTRGIGHSRTNNPKHNK